MRYTELVAVMHVKRNSYLPVRRKHATTHNGAQRRRYVSSQSLCRCMLINNIVVIYCPCTS